jgi:peptidoglycan-associated lipoprotein
MKPILTLVYACLTLSLVGCPKPPKKDDPILDASPEVKGESLPDDKPKGLTDEQVLRQTLEEKRQKVEQMINKIMSEDIYFNYDNATITEKARELLAQVGELLVKDLEFSIVIEGHTDSRGTTSYNLSLGSSRAQVVQKYLVDYGVAQNRISTVSFGEEKPKIDGETEKAFSKNRRANFQVKIIEK